MSNTFKLIDQITKMAAVEFHDQLTFCNTINRQYDGSFAQSGAQIGNTLRIRLPNDFEAVKNNLDITSAIKPYTERNTSLALTSTATVPLSFTTEELTFNMDDVFERVVKPATHRLAVTVETDAIAYAHKHTTQAVGTRGTQPTAVKTFNLARAKARKSRAPLSDMHCLLNLDTEVEVIDGLKGLFEAKSEISRQYTEGTMGRALGMDWHVTNCYYTHVNGAYAGTPLTNGANQGITTGWAETTSLVTDGWTSGQLSAKEGDIITIADVYATKPGDSTSLGYLRQFRVTADVTDTSGAATLVISPAIISGGQYQNCTVRAGDGKAITFLGNTGVSSPENLVYHKNAFIMGMADLNIDGAVLASRVSDPETGISIALIRQMDPLTRNLITRLDCIYGFSAPAPEYACRVVG